MIVKHFTAKRRRRRTNRKHNELSLKPIRVRDGKATHVSTKANELHLWSWLWLCRKQWSLLGGWCRWLQYNGGQRRAAAVHCGTSQTLASRHSFHHDEQQLRQRRAEWKHLGQVPGPRASHALGVLNTRRQHAADEFQQSTLMSKIHLINLLYSVLNGIALRRKPTSELRGVIYHMESHSVTWHRTQVRTPCHNPSRYSIYLPQVEGWWKSVLYEKSIVSRMFTAKLQKIHRKSKKGLQQTQSIPTCQDVVQGNWTYCTTYWQQIEANGFWALARPAEIKPKINNKCSKTGEFKKTRQAELADTKSDWSNV